MRHLHFRRNLRSLVFVCTLAFVVGVPCLLWWANRTGLPDGWRSAIETELSKKGFYVRIGGLSYLPLRGLMASNVRVFSDDRLHEEVSTVERVVVGFDRTRLARGVFEITKLELRNGTFSMPADPGAPDGRRIAISGAQGTLLLPGSRRFEIRDAKGWIEGIEVQIHARLIGYGGGGGRHKGDRPDSPRRRAMVDFLNEVSRWGFDPQEPPLLRMWVEGDLNRPSTLRSRMILESARMEKNGVGLRDVSCTAEAEAGILTVRELKAEDGTGKLDLRLDYDPVARGGRFEGASTLELFPVLDAWFGMKRPDQLIVAGRPTIDIHGGFTIPESGRPVIEAIGRLDCGSVMVRGVLLNRLTTMFSWKDGILFFRDATLEREDGRATGKLLIEWPLVRLSMRSDFPLSVYQPFFADKPLERVIRDFREGSGSSITLALEGGFSVNDPHSWAYTGHAAARNVAFRGVPLTHASCDLMLTHAELEFSNGKVGFDYTDYALRRAFDGPRQGEATVERVLYSRSDETVAVEGVSGRIWASPLIRLFAAKVADQCEAYRFHTPPQLEGSGIVDVGQRGRTALDISFQTDRPANYRFLGQDVVLSSPQGAVRVRDKDVTVDGLACSAFGGPVRGQVQVRSGGSLGGELNWTRIPIPELSRVYGFSMKAGGNLTGRLEFEMNKGRIETMQGRGLLALENSELFSVPIFGPLSPLISGVLNDRNAGFEQASDAFCNFSIRDGVLTTVDFSTSTRSLAFAGNGEVDLSKQTIDMTMRMNARGFFGFLTLPLRPFYGMFQFRGRGPLRHPEWENVMFTQPPKEQVEKLKPPPKARVVD